MNQEIGIHFFAKGQDTVVAAVDEIRRKLETLQKDLGNANKLFTFGETLNKDSVSHAEKLAAAFEKLSASAAGVSNLAGAVKNLAASTAQLVEAQAGMRNYSSLGRAGASPRGSAASGVDQHSGPPLASQNPRPSAIGPFPANGYGEPWREPHRPSGWSNGMSVWEPNWQTGGSSKASMPGGFFAFNKALPPGMGPFGHYGDYWKVREDLGGRGGGGGGFRRGGSFFRGLSDSWNNRHNWADALNSGFWPFGTMIKYGGAGMMTYGTARLLHRGVTDILGGGARTENVKEFGRLLAVGQSPEEAFQTEREGQILRQTMPWITMPEYMKSRAESASYWSSFSPGYQKYNAEQAMMLAKIGQMDNQFEANRILNDTVKLQWGHLKPEERNEAKLYELTKTSRAQLARAFQLNPLWAKDWSDYQKYAFATHISKGDSLAHALAYVGTMKPGYRPSTIGRADNRFMTAETEKIASLLLQAEKGVTKESFKGKGAAQKFKAAKLDYANQIRWQMETDPGAIDARLYQAVEQLRAAGHADPFAEHKFSTQFGQQYRTRIQPGVQKDIAEMEAQIEAADPHKQEIDFANNLKYLTTGTEQVSVAFKSLSEEAAKVYNTFERFQGVADYINKMTAGIERNYQTGKVTEGFDKLYPSGMPIPEGKEQQYMKNRLKAYYHLEDVDATTADRAKFIRRSDPRARDHPWLTGAVNWIEDSKDYVHQGVLGRFFDSLNLGKALAEESGALGLADRGTKWIYSKIFGGTGDADENTINKFKTENQKTMASPSDVGMDFFSGALRQGGSSVMSFADAVQIAITKINNAKTENTPQGQAGPGKSMKKLPQG